MGKPKGAEPETTQDEPTKPWDHDAAGRPIDQWGLPINGPARIEALAQRGGDDPALAAADPAEQAPAPDGAAAQE